MNNSEEQKLRKRAAKRNVPDTEKDSAYWERRSRNNAAAKRSREIKRQQENIYKSFVNTSVALIERTKLSVVQPLLQYCPPELRRNFEREFDSIYLQFNQSLPKIIVSPSERHSSPNEDDGLHHDDQDTDFGSHSSIMSEPGDDTPDLQIISVENGPSRINQLPPQLSPAPSIQIQQTQQQAQLQHQQQTLPPPTTFPESTFETKTSLTSRPSMPLPRTVIKPETVNLPIHRSSPAAKTPLSRQQLPNGNVEAHSEGALPKPQLDVPNGIPVFVGPEGVHALLRNPILNMNNPHVHDVLKQIMSTVLIPDPTNALGQAAPRRQAPIPDLPRPLNGNSYVPTDSKATPVLSANQNRQPRTTQEEWTNSQQNVLAATATTTRQNKKHKPFANFTDYSLKFPTTEMNQDAILNLANQPQAVQDLVPLVKRVFVGLHTNAIVDIIHTITQEFLANMGDKVPSVNIIWQIFIAIRDAVSSQSFQPLDCGPVIRAKFSELNHLSSDKMHKLEAEVLPYQDLLTQFSNYLSQQLKQKRGRSPTENEDPAPKRARTVPDKSNSQLPFVNLRNLESADGGVIDNALHRCSVELEKRSQMRFRELERLRDTPGMTIDQLHDAVKRITNDSEPFEHLFDSAVQSEILEAKIKQNQRRSYPSNGAKKK